jgi:hypothetical protein
MSRCIKEAKPRIWPRTCSAELFRISGPERIIVLGVREEVGNIVFAETKEASQALLVFAAMFGNKAEPERLAQTTPAANRISAISS